MIAGPSADALLEAVTAFLASREVRTALPGDLSFRALIAANLCQQLLAERRHGAALDTAHADRLDALLGTGPDVDAAQPLEARERALIDRHGDAAPGSAVWVHARTTLAQSLAAANPRFDLRPDLP